MYSDDVKLKSILILGYFALNVGDDLFIKTVLERYSKCRFYIYADKKYINPFTNYKNITIIYKHSIPILIKLWNKYIDKEYIAKKEINYLCSKVIDYPIDTILTLSGSFFMESDIKCLLYKKLRETIPNLKLYFLGCNFGPFHSDYFYSYFYNLFYEAEDVCFRDKYSVSLFSKLRNIRVAPDIVFGLKINNKKQIIPDSIGISIINPKRIDALNNDEISYYNFIEFIIKQGIINGQCIKLFSFCKQGGDEKSIKYILRRLPSNIKGQISITCYNGNIEEFLYDYSQMEYVICSRYHSMILSIIYGQKFYPIIYSNKMTQVIEDLDFIQSYCTIDNLPNSINDIKYNSVKIEKIVQLQNDSTNHFKLLDKYVNYKI